MPRTQDLRVARMESLSPPETLKGELQATEAHYETVAAARETIRDILHGRDERTLVIVGPCSIHDPAVGLEYAQRLSRLRDELADTLYIVMRVYFEKPRTTVGWKGLINDPHLDGTCDIQAGMRLARQQLLDVTALGLPAATELLDPITPQYLADLISWTAVGARTTESQTHREMASGLSMPVGFKNGTDGNLLTALHAVQSAREPHAFLGIDQQGSAAIVHTTGNPECHIVLRGGGQGPNYSAEAVAGCQALLDGKSIDTRIIVDCSHAQTEKDFTRQTDVLKNIVGQIHGGGPSIAGVMLESNLHAGRQDLVKPLRYGVSITDGCIDWDTTAECLRRAADALTPAPR